MTAGEGRGRREQAPSPQARSGLRRNMDVSWEQESQNDFWRPPAPDVAEGAPVSRLPSGGLSCRVTCLNNELIRSFNCFWEL